MFSNENTSYSLISAVHKGRLKRVRELIDSFGLSYSPAWSGGYVLLRDAIAKKRTDIAILLLTYNSKVNSRNRKPTNTPLHFAARNGNIKIVEMLLNRDANIDVKNKSGKTPLHIAIENKKTKITELLLNRGANVETRDGDGDTPLHYAAWNETLQIAKDLLKHGACVNSGSISVWGEGFTPLHVAAYTNKEMVELLLSSNAHVDAYTEYNLTPLYVAVNTMLGIKISKLLLQHGANVDIKVKHDWTILYVAAKMGCLPTVKLILKYHPDVNNKRNRSSLNAALLGSGRECSKIIKSLLQYGFTINLEDGNNCELLHAAVEKGCLKIVEDLLKYGTDVNMLCTLISDEVCTPLHRAAMYKREEIAKLLINYGADVNAKDGTEKTPIFYAIRNSDSEITKLLLTNRADIRVSPELLSTAIQKECRKIVEVLLQYDADINTSDQFGRTALHFTASCDDGGFIRYSIKDLDNNVMGEFAKLLLSKGAKVNAQTTNGRLITTLHSASERGYTEVVEALLEYNADVNCAVQRDITPLHLAAEEGNEIICKMLLNKGANINARENYGMTALRMATEKGRKEVVELLLKCGAQVDATLLHVAVGGGYLEIVKILLELGVDIDNRNDNGNTAFHIGFKNGHEQVVKVLLEYGADIDSRDGQGNTAFHIASKNGLERVFKVLLEYGADIDSRDGQGNTAFHIASKNGLERVFKVLLEYGADIDSRDVHGNTALHIASKEGHCEFVKSLLEYGADINIMNKNNHTPLGSARVYEPFYNQYDSFDSDIEYYNQCPSTYACEMILKQHIVKMKTANLYVSKENLLLINGRDEMSDFRNECEKEVEMMKGEKISNTHVSFHDILTENISQLARYARNETVVQVLKSDDYETKYPIYAGMINSRFRKGIRRKELLEQGNKYLYSLFKGVADVPQNCTEKIFSYLSDKDLKIVIDACKPTNVSNPNTDRNDVTITSGMLSTPNASHQGDVVQ